MGAGWWGNRPEDDVAWAALIEQGRQRAAAAASAWDASTAAYAAQIAGSAPWMNPGTVLALAKSNARPETIATAARAAAAERAQLPNVAPGSLVTGAELHPGDRRLFTPSPNQAENWGRGRPLGPMQRFLNRASENVRRTAAERQAVAAEEERLRGLGIMDEEGRLQVPVSARALHTNDRPNYIDLDEVRRVSPEGAAAVSELVNLLDRLGEPVSFATADGSVVDYNPETGRILTHHNFEKVNPFSLEGVIPEAVGRFMSERHLPTLGDLPGLRGTDLGQATQTAGPGTGVPSITESVQQAGIVANAPIQEFTGQIRNVYAAATGRPVDWTESQSDFGIMVGTGMEPGDGLFVDPDSQVAQERLRREAERGLIYGQRVTLGRLVAGGLTHITPLDPETTAYRVLSGMVDVVPQVVDPTALAAAGVGRANLARTLFVQGSEEIAETAARNLVGTSTLKSLASSLGVRGRGGMGRDDLLRALGTHAPADWDASTLRGVATSLNIPGRTRMSQQALRDAVSERWANLGGQTEATRTLGAAEPPTSRAAAVGLGLAEATRVTGIPQLLNRAGLVRGSFVDRVHGPTAEYWFQTPQGSRAVAEVASEGDILRLDQMTGNKLTLGELRALRDADSPDAVRNALRPMLGRSIRSTTDVWRNPAVDFPVIRTMRNTWYLSDVPGSYIDLEDPRSPIDETVAWLRNAHVPESVQSHFVGRLADAKNNNEIFDVIEDVMNHTDGVLAQAGMRSTTARREMTTAWRNEMQQAQAYFVSEATEQQSLFDDIVVGGKTYPTGGPYEWHAAYNRFIYLPDYREVRRITSDIPTGLLWNAEGKLRKPAALTMALQEDIWKPMTLLRAAWPVRVIGEEQLRMAAAGYASMWSDPLSFAAWAIARKEDFTGEAFDTARDFVESQVARTNGWLNERPGVVRTGQQAVYHRGEKGWVDAWANTFVELHQDPIARRLAQGNDIDEVQDWLENGAGREVWDFMRENHPEMFLGGSASLRRYLESTARWNDVITGGHDDLLQVIREGTIGRWEKPTVGQVRQGQVGRWKAISDDGFRPTPQLLRQLDRTYYDAGPQEVLGVKNITEHGYRGAIVDRLFGMLMGKPTNYLSRSPVFRQAYQRRMEEMLSFASPEAKAEILARAKTTERIGPIKITEAPKDAIRRMERVKATGTMSVAELDTYAKGFALDETRDLLYDLTKKSQIADSMRLVWPFAEAWREVLTRWASLAANPRQLGRSVKNLRRAQQVAQGAMGQDFGEVMGAPDVWNPDTGEFEQGGFVWKDEFGESVFIYPGSQWLTGSVTDAVGEKVPVPLVGTVGGLSMFGEVLPGIGPVAAIPTSWFLPDKPGTRGLREFLLPYGSPSDEQGQSAFFQMLNYAPPWMRRGFQFLTGGGYDQETNRLWANTVMATANYLYSTGRYDTSSPAGQTKLLEDAKGQARVLYGVRALASFGAPSAPSLDFLTKTDEGLVRTAMLRDDYFRIREEQGYEAADELFLDRWGWMAGMAMQAQTREIQGGIVPSEEFGDWASSGTGTHLRNTYPAVWAFFGPGGGEFDYDVYVRQVRSGEREALTPDEWLRLGQNHLGQMLFDHLMESLGPEENWTEEDRDFKREIEGEIAAEYPGFRDFSGLSQRADQETIMRQLAEAVQDERVLDTEVGEALSLYWQARMKVVGWAEDDGLAVSESEPWTYDLSKARSLAEDRQWLWEIGEELATTYSDFARLWDRQLRHEVEPEDEEG